VFASSVVPGDSSDLHNALPGNNLYGVYGSFQNIVPKADVEPYVLWRVAPVSSELPETLNRGHLNEVTVGLRWKGDLPASFDYDAEFDGQTGSLGASSIAAGRLCQRGKNISQGCHLASRFSRGQLRLGNENAGMISFDL